MHIAQLIQYLDVGGLERMTASLSGELVQMGHDVTVFSYLSEDGPMREAFERAGVEVVRLSKREGFDVRLVGALAAELDRRGVDLLHTHHLGPFLYGRSAAACVGAAVVHTEHSHEFYDAPRRALVGASMSALGEVVAVTPEISRWRERAFGRGCEVIQNGVHVPRPDREGARRARALLGLEEGDFAIGCVARLAPEKDHATLLRAMRVLAMRVARPRLFLIGDGPERAALERMACALGIDDLVEFMGQRGDVEALLRGMDVITLTSKREGLPLALLEGMARELPVVATAVGGVPELLAEGGGALAQPGDHGELARALTDYARDPLRRRRDGAFARALVQQQYSIKIMARRYVQIYGRALNAQPWLEEVA
jgi:glycosyltransferase involved in cell wall biosynthesis